MKKLKKIMTVALSLVLCASLVAPGLAATFTELQAQINGAEDGATIKLEDNYEADEATSHITIGMGQKINLDLNGHTLTGDERSSVIKVSGGSLTLEDSSEDGSGLITGGGKDDVNGGGVAVSGGTFTMNGGTISGNNARFGGGVYVQNDGEFTMNGGTISGNSAAYGGGVSAYKGSVTVKDGTISENKAGSYGGGVYNGGTFTMEGGSISENSAGSYAGGVYNVGTFTMKDGTISGNAASSYAGGVYNGGTFTMEDGNISGNAAGAGADDIMNATNATISLPKADQMNATLDGKKITGWYYDFGVDGDAGWGGSGESAYAEYSGPLRATGMLLIKAAHDEYFTVTDKEGNVLAEVEKGTEITLPTPAEREGYKFLGWTDENGEPVTTVTVDKAITLVARWEKIEQPTDSDEPIVTPNEPDHSGASDVEVADSAVPLASGPITRAQFIDYLWRHEGQPEGAPCTFIDVAEDHEFALALGWAQEQGIAVADENGAFQPDELVCVGAVQEFLSNFAQISGMDADVYALASLTGGVDEAVLNCDEVVAEFFGEFAQAA